jgi:hypothetical protein
VIPGNTRPQIRLKTDDERTGAMIIIMQRLHMDDVVGHVLEQGDSDVVSLPAIAEVEEKHFIESSVYARREVIRHVGEALHPAREPIEVLHDRRQTGCDEGNPKRAYALQFAGSAGG